MGWGCSSRAAAGAQRTAASRARARGSRGFCEVKKRGKEGPRVYGQVFGARECARRGRLRRREKPREPFSGGVSLVVKEAVQGIKSV